MPQSCCPCSLQVIHDLYSYVDARTGRSASLIRSHLSRLQRTNHLNILSARRLTASWWPMLSVLTQQLYTLATMDSTTSVSKRWKGPTSCESKASSSSARRCHFNTTMSFHTSQRHAASPHASRGWDPQGVVHTYIFSLFSASFICRATWSASLRHMIS